ncbi:MAG: carboxymuconolactone decarboxylase family protein [Pseudonocardiales bacterium]|nr:carboxymuconolactone decarboxylase family protein [Pseudonocardiales bacterium]MBV9728773.1 carboxymuconolactone decarboxylase family protein [Pseudonocardiales bacterium]
MIACQAVSEYRVMTGAALTIGVTPVVIKEIVYQAVPYVGMAKVFDFLMLVSLGGCEPQVKGHVAANLHVGNDRARLLDVLTQLIPYIGYPRTLNGLHVLDELTSA